MKTPLQPLPTLVNAQQYHGGFESFSFIDQWLIHNNAEAEVHDRDDHLKILTENCLFHVNPTDYILIIGSHVQVYTQDFYYEHYREG